MAGRSRKSFKISATNLRHLKKNDPLWGNLQNSVPKGFMATLIHNLCVNFVRFGGPEIGKVVHYLPHKKTILPRSRFCTDCAQNLPGQAADNVLRVPQISCKSVHFRQSYSRMHEHRQNAS